MRVRITPTDLLDELIESLNVGPDVAVTQTAADEAEVSVLGSYNADAMRMELYLRLRAWEAVRTASSVRVEIVG